MAGVLRLLRGLSAQLESVASLRLAVPRAVLLQEHLPAGAAPRAATPNPGWPDSGVEVVATPFVRPPPAIEVAHRGAAARTLRPRAGSLLLLLARQARCAVPPAPSAALSLTLPIYSAWRRRDILALERELDELADRAQLELDRHAPSPQPRSFLARHSASSI